MQGEAVTGRTPAFGDEAHRVLARTRAAARRLRHDHLGTEHLLLGLLDEPHGLARALLHEAGIAPAQVREGVALLAPPGGADPETEFVMAPELRHALRLATEEGRQLGDGEVRSEHLLLATLHEGTGRGAVVLRALGLDLAVLRLAITRERPGGSDAHVASGWVARGPYQALAWLAASAIVAALVTALWWVVAALVHRPLGGAYLLLVPLVLLGVGMAALGSSRMEAQRGAATVEAVVEEWRQRRAPAQLAEALRLAEAGQDEAAQRLLTQAVTRPMPAAEYRAAVAAVTPWLAHEDWRANALRARGELHLRAERLDLALADVTQALQVGPEQAEWHYTRAAILARLGRREEAMSAYREAVRLQPDAGRYWAELALLTLRRGALVEAAEAAGHATERAPGLPLSHVAQASVHYTRGELDEADAAVAAGLALDPDDPGALANQSALLLRRVLPEQALAVARRATVVASEPSAALAALEGWALAALGQGPEARAAFADARTRDPDLVPMCGRLALALDAEGREAAAAYQRQLAAQLAG